MAGKDSPLVVDPDGLDTSTRGALSRYLRDTQALPNESAKTHRFIALVSELFPGSPAVTEFAAGVEKLVRIQASSGTRRGRIDSYHGNAIIEFENSLKATGKVALEQLKNYTAAIWSAKRQGASRALLCIATDGVVWKAYRPFPVEAAGKSPAAEQVALEHLRTLTLTSETLRDFWIWLTSLLFRPFRIEPTAERFRIDFGATSIAFSDTMAALCRAWGIIRAAPEARLAFETWQTYLTVTYGKLGESGGEKELESLFLKHTYLASVARLLIWAALSGGRTTQPLRKVAADVLSGRYFESQGIENLVEDDFFQWVRRPAAEAVLAAVWERNLDQILTYSLEELDQDILKGVYQELVDPKDRHDLGEYYTPDWLCENIVRELLPGRGYVSVIDPTCGSGSFLRAVITHFIRVNPNGGDAQGLRDILDNVVGIDIHPLAVTISRATYLLAIRALVKASQRPIQIPVYMADSLFLPSEVQQPELGDVAGYKIRFGGDRSVTIPNDLVRAADLFDPAVACCTKVAVDHARMRSEDIRTLRAYLRRALPTLGERCDFEQITTALWRFTEELADLIRKQRNSIWAFIIRNAYRPAMFRSRFNVVLGNPPWLSYRYIADPDYQREVKKRALEEYQIAPRQQRLMTHMELALVFLVHTLSTFGKPGARLGFVMPRSILAGDQYANFIKGAYDAPVRADQYWDLLDVRPIFNVPACVVFATHDEKTDERVPGTLPATLWHGRLPSRDAPASVTDKYLVAEKKTARRIFLGTRVAFSTKPGRTKPATASPYAGTFRQGATIVPRSFYFVQVRDLSGAIDPDRLYWAETDSKQAESAKPPYEDVHLKGNVEGRFIFCSALSKHVVPFALLPPPTIVLPITSDEDGIKVKNADQLRSDGFRELAKWMAEAERIWNEKREAKATRQTLYQWLDYQRKLTHQDLRARFLVLYNAAGTNLSAASVDRTKLSAPFIVEHKLYWAACRTKEEADYLAALLNSPSINEAIKPFQSMGLLGERDIEKKVLELQFPRFDRTDATHRALASLGARARADVAKLVQSTELPASLALRRGLVRKSVASLLEDIDRHVRLVLG